MHPTFRALSNHLKMILFFVMAGQKREARLRAGCPGHPCLSCSIAAKTWMPGTHLRRGFDGLFRCYARRSFSEGGKAGHDEFCYKALFHWLHFKSASQDEEKMTRHFNP